MSEKAVLGFPVLNEEGGGFAEGVRYEVSATIRYGAAQKELVVEHCLVGGSFVRDWILSGDACFATRVLFRGSAQRDAIPFDGDPEKLDNTVIARQHIPVLFSYPPEVSCSIFAVRDRKLIIRHPECGLSDFWIEGERLRIPQYARIGRHRLLTFDDGTLPSLIQVKCDENFDDGHMATIVNEYAPEGTKPVTLSLRAGCL